MSLLDTELARKVIFVDVLSNQMTNLESSLREDFPLDKYNWQIRCEDVRNIVVPEIHPQLFVIAGIGGGQTVNFINSLSMSAADAIFDVLVCSVHGSYFVRESLVHNGFSLLNEKIILDRNRIYEGIYATKSPGKALVTTGYSMWNWNDLDHQRYWSRLVGHYTQKARNEPDKFRPILEKYEALKRELLG